MLGLLRGHGHADTAYAVALRRKLERFAPAAADVEHAHAGRQLQLATDEVEFGQLRGIEVTRLGPIGAAVDESCAEHRRKQVVAEVIVASTHRPAAGTVLHVPEPMTRGEHSSQLATRPAIGTVQDQPLEATGQVVRIPPAVDVGVAESQRTLGERTREHSWIDDPNVPRRRTVERHATTVEQPLDARAKCARRRGKQARAPAFVHAGSRRIDLLHSGSLHHDRRSPTPGARPRGGA